MLLKLACCFVFVFLFQQFVPNWLAKYCFYILDELFQFDHIVVQSKKDGGSITLDRLTVNVYKSRLDSLRMEELSQSWHL